MYLNTNLKCGILHKTLIDYCEEFRGRKVKKLLKDICKGYLTHKNYYENIKNNNSHINLKIK